MLTKPIVSMSFLISTLAILVVSFMLCPFLAFRLAVSPFCGSSVPRLLVVDGRRLLSPLDCESKYIADFGYCDIVVVLVGKARVFHAVFEKQLVKTLCANLFAVVIERSMLFAASDTHIRCKLSHLKTFSLSCLSARCCLISCFYTNYSACTIYCQDVFIKLFLKYFVFWYWLYMVHAL